MCICETRLLTTYDDVPPAERKICTHPVSQHKSQVVSINWGLCVTYHVNNLHQRQTEAQLQRIGLVDHGPFQHIVRIEQMMQQALLVRSGFANWKTFETRN